MHRGQITKRQSGPVWEGVPSIQGSRWGFIAAMIAVFVILVLLLCICVCVCRRRSSKKRMKRAGKGDNLPTVHPAPIVARPRPAEPAKPSQPQYMLDEEERGGYNASHYNNNNAAHGQAPYAAAMAADKYNHGNQMQMSQMDAGQYGYHNGQHQQHPYDAYDYQGHTTNEPQFEVVAAPSQQSHSYSQQNLYSQQHGYPQSDGGYDYNNSQYGPASSAHSQFPVPGSRYQSPAPPSSMNIAPSQQQQQQQHYSSPLAMPSAGYQQEEAAYPRNDYAGSSSHYPATGAAGAASASHDDDYAEEPPAYPQGSTTMHTHDDSKYRMGPRAV